MLKELRTRLAVLWVAAVIVIAAGTVAYGIAFTANTAVVWLMAVLIRLPSCCWYGPARHL